MMPTFSRRHFLATATAASLFRPALSHAADEESNDDARIAAVVAKTFGIDTHNHIDVPLAAAELPGPAVDLAGELKKSGLAAICMTFAVDYQKLTEPGQAFDRFTTGLDAMDRILESNRIKRSLNLADLISSHGRSEPTVVQSVEGCHFLEGKLERLAIAYDRGLRHLGLLHDSDATTPLGDVYTNAPRLGGLTDFGAEVIKESNRLGMLATLPTPATTPSTPL